MCYDTIALLRLLSCHLCPCDKRYAVAQSLVCGPGTWLDLNTHGESQYMWQLNLPTNNYKSSNNKKYQQKSTNLPTNIYKSSNNKRYQQKPTSTALYWPRTTKYQLGTAYTDPVPPFTDPEPSTLVVLGQYRTVLVGTWWYWVSVGRS